MIKRKTKKRITKVLLFVVLVSTLISTFSIFSSAYSPNEIPFFYVPRSQVNINNPIYPDSSPRLYANLSERADSVLMLPIDNSSRFYLSSFSYLSYSNPWFLMPVASRKGEGTYQDIIEALNNSEVAMNNSNQGSWRNTTSIITTTNFDATFISFPDFSDGWSNYSPQITLEPQDNWYSYNYDWYPVYQVAIDFDVLKLGPGGTDYLINAAYFEPSFYTKPVWNNSLLASINSGFDFYSKGTILNNNGSPVNVPIFNVPLEDSNGDKIIGGQIHIGCIFYKKDTVYDSLGQKNDKSAWEIYDSSVQSNYLWTNGCYFYKPDAFSEFISVSQHISELSSTATQKYNEGRQHGYDAGYLEGVEAGENYNAVDGVLALAQVPGTFISGMLDFDFFGVNLASAVKVIFTVLVVGFLIVLILKFLL